MTLRLRMPWWVVGEATVTGPVGETAARAAGGEIVLTVDSDRQYLLEMPCALSTCPLPDAPGTFAFMEGPDVLVGLTNVNTLSWDGDVSEAWRILRPVTRSPFLHKFNRYAAVQQSQKIEFIPLRFLADEAFTLYFTLDGR